MTSQIAVSGTSRPASLPFGGVTMSLPEMWDDDMRERMIVERAMRPRSWEPDAEG